MEQGGEETDTSLSYGPKMPPGWAEVSVTVDMPRPPSEHAKLADEQIAAAQKVLARMPKTAPERDLIEIGIRQMQAGSEMFAGMALAPPKTRASMILCTRCQEGPVFEVVQKRVEAQTMQDVGLPLVSPLPPGFFNGHG